MMKLCVNITQKYVDSIKLKILLGGVVEQNLLSLSLEV